MPKSDTPRRWFGLWPAAARRPQDDPADLGTAFGLDLSLDELADDTSPAVASPVDGAGGRMHRQGERARAGG